MSLLTIRVISLPAKLVAYWTNNGQTSILDGDGYDVNDPTRTSATWSLKKPRIEVSRIMACADLTIFLGATGV